MSIKQSGGVFGRNPTFNDVTIEGQLTFDGDIDINSDLKVDGDLDVIGNVTTTKSITLNGAGSGNGLLKNINTGFGVGTERWIGADGTLSTWFYNVPTGGKHYIAVNNLNKLSVDGDNVNVLLGNLVIGTSGKGIDFSATSGTGTSELLSDYEEGSWTMVLSSASGSFSTATLDPIATAFYTKVGRQVSIQGYFRTDAITVGTASGDIYISLPFAAAALTGAGDASAGAVAYAASWAGDIPSAVSPRGGDTKMNLIYRTSANGSTSNSQVGDLGTGSDANVIIFSSTYIAA